MENTTVNKGNEMTKFEVNEQGRCQNCNHVEANHVDEYCVAVQTVHDHFASIDIDPACDFCQMASAFRPLAV